MAVVVRQKQPGKGNPWWVFINHRGRRKAKCIGDKRAAEAVASAIRVQLKKGDLNLPEDRGIPTFEAYAKKWLETYVKGTLKETTYAGYEMLLRLHLFPAFGKMRLDEIKRVDVKEFLLRLGAKGCAVGTILHTKNTMSGVFSSAVEDGIVTANPAAKTGKFVRQRGQTRPASFLTRDEVRLFLDAVLQYYPAHYPLFLCLVRTGFRIGEALGLEWGDVDFNGRFIEVKRARVKGKITTTKNGKWRRVDMSLQLAEVLKTLRLERKKEALRQGRPDIGERVFCLDKGEALDVSNVRARVFHKCLEKAGLRRVRLHDLRHSFASLLLAQGESLVYVKEQMGHSSIRVTVDVYGHLVPGSNKGAVDKLDDVGAENRNLYATSGLTADGIKLCK